MLSKRDIEKELGKGINIVPLRTKNIKGNSINLTIGKNAWTLGSGSIIKETSGKFSLAKSQTTPKNKTYLSRGDKAIIRNGNKNYLVLLPHSTTIVETSEVLAVENYIGGTLHSKVGTVALGIGHIGTMLGPCFSGHLMVSLHNITDDLITIPVGETFVSVVFHYLDTPTAEGTNSNISGHVDKLAELGVNIDPGTRAYLTDDWKLHVETVRNKMRDSDEYKSFRKMQVKTCITSIRRYINIRNIIVFAIFAILAFVGYKFAVTADLQNGNSVWTDRYWTWIGAGIIIPAISCLWNWMKKS